jgi:hypothetical protein
MSAPPDEWRKPDRLWPRRVFWFVIVVVSVGLVVRCSVPNIHIGPVKAVMTEKFANARSFSQAGQMLALDEKESGGGGFPADLAVKTAREFIDRLVKSGHITEQERRKFKLDDFVIVNIAASDPPETAFLLSKSYFDVKYRYPDVKNWSFIVFRKDGNGGIYTRPSDRLSGAVILPDRNPQFLLNE